MVFVTDYYTPPIVSKYAQPSAPNKDFQHDNINFHLPGYATNDVDPDNINFAHSGSSNRYFHIENPNIHTNRS